MTNLRSTFWILLAGAAGMCTLLALLPAAGHDQLWCLYVARHALDGEALYGPALMESNPPLIVWLSMVPAALAGLLHLPAPAVGKSMVILLQAVVAFVCVRQVRRFVQLSGSAWAALAFAFVTLFDVVPARDLGQRDFLLALLCLPYLLAAAERSGLAPDSTATRASSPVPAAARFAIGLAAGLGLALKPHYALFAVAVETWLIVRSRSLRTLLRPEPVAILITAIGYVAVISYFTPAYLTTILPILRETYWAVGSLSLPQLVGQAIELHILGMIALALFLGAKRRDRSWVELCLLPVLLLAGAAATVAYYLQGTGWYYQQLPGIIFFGLAVALELLPQADRAVPAWTPRAAGLLALVALVLTAHFMNYPFTPARSFAIDTPDPDFFEYLPPGTPVATITTTVDHTVMPAERYGLTIAQRYPHLWMMPAILRNETPYGRARHTIPTARLAELDRTQHRFMLEDFQRWRPQLVLVSRCQDPAVQCQLLQGRHDDLLAWFLRDPAFAAEWKHYTFTASRGPYDAYTRNPAANSLTR